MYARARNRTKQGVAGGGGGGGMGGWKKRADDPTIYGVVDDHLKIQDQKRAHLFSCVCVAIRLTLLDLFRTSYSICSMVFHVCVSRDMPSVYTLSHTHEKTHLL